MTETALEIAFELASSGKVTSVADIKTELRARGLDPEQVSGPSLRKQLKQEIDTARQSTVQSG